MRKVFVRTPYNYDGDEASYASGMDFGDEESLAVQSSKDECDINVIVRRFGVTGVVPANVRAPMYGDFSNVGDFRSAMDAIRGAEESFMAMASDVRARFHNDPQEFLEFCSNKDNLAEMRKMGLAVPEPPVVQAAASGVAGDGKS